MPTCLLSGCAAVASVIASAAPCGRINAGWEGGWAGGRLRAGCGWQAAGCGPDAQCRQADSLSRQSSAATAVCIISLASHHNPAFFHAPAAGWGAVAPRWREVSEGRRRAAEGRPRRRPPLIKAIGRPPERPRWAPVVKPARARRRAAAVGPRRAALSVQVSVKPPAAARRRRPPPVKVGRPAVVIAVKAARRRPPAVKGRPRAVQGRPPRRPAITHGRRYVNVHPSCKAAHAAALPLPLRLAPLLLLPVAARELAAAAATARRVLLPLFALCGTSGRRVGRGTD